MGASVAEFHFGSHGGQQIARGLDVADLRNVFEDDGLIGEQGGGHAGKCGVLCAADVDGAEERLSAADDEFIHEDESSSDCSGIWRRATLTEEKREDKDPQFTVLRGTPLSE